MSVMATAAHLTEASNHVPVLDALAAGIEIAQIRARLASRVGVPPTPRTGAHERCAREDLDRVFGLFGRR